MHYSAYAFSKNGQPTIRSKEPGKSFGQRNGLSWRDIETVERMYGKSTDEFAALSGYLAPGRWNDRQHLVGDEHTIGTGDVATFVPAMQGLMTFDAGAVPSGSEIELATLTVYQYATRGNPFRDLGNLLVDLVDVGSTIEASDYNATALISNVGTLSRGPTEGSRVLDVTEAVRYAHERGLLWNFQLRTRFENTTDQDDVEDSVRMYGAVSDRDDLLINPARVHAPQLRIEYTE